MCWDLKQNASVFLVCKNHWILSISGHFSLLGPGFVSKKHSRLLLSLMSWEYLALGVLQPHSTTQNTVSGPHAVLVVDEHENRPETRPTQFPALPLNFPPFARPYDFVAPRWATKHRANSPELMTCRHLEYARHAGAAIYFLSKMKSHT